VLSGRAFVCLVDGILYELDRCSAGSLCTFVSIALEGLYFQRVGLPDQCKESRQVRRVPSKIQSNRNLRRVGLNGSQICNIVVVVFPVPSILTSTDAAVLPMEGSSRR
jgi:hypothetical protein